MTGGKGMYGADGPEEKEGLCWAEVECMARSARLSVIVAVL